jgi:hypothetical protein
MIAGGWTALLIFYRLLDKPGLQGNQRVTATVGVEWGIFIALLLALGLVYAGWRMRAAESPEPPLVRPRGARRRPRVDPDATAPVPSPVRPRGSAPVPARGRAPFPPAPQEQLPFEDPPTRRE